MYLTITTSIAIERNKGANMTHPHRFQRTPLAAALGVALLPLVASPVQAQLEEVVVTATKQAESLQDVPISVNALSGDSCASRES